MVWSTSEAICPFVTSRQPTKCLLNNSLYTVADTIAEQRALQARRKRVYISGIQGQHSLELAVAYYYRGHTIYSASGLWPIEPIPFSTKKGISILGILDHLEPRYNPYTSGLVPEASIGVLDHACQHARTSLKSKEEAKKNEPLEEDDSTENIEGKTKKAPEALNAFSNQGVFRVTSYSPRSPCLDTAHQDMLDTSSLTIPGNNTASPFTPYSRAQFLATSAPGSHNSSSKTTPQSSRPISPFHNPLCATTGFSRLPKNKGTSLQALSICKTAPAKPYTPLSHSPLLYLPGLGQTTQPQNLPATTARVCGSPLSQAHAASIALDTAYNTISPAPYLSSPTSQSSLLDKPAGAAPSYALYENRYNNKIVHFPHRIEKARIMYGFKEAYPMITAGGRIMIDWARLFEEECVRVG